MRLQQESQISKTNLLRKCGLLAHTSAAFLKNCCTEKLFVCLRLIIDKPLFLEKPPESGSARLGHIPSLPWESQLPLKPCISLQPLDFKGNCDSSDCFLDFCFVSRCSFDLLRKCGLLAHTSAAFLKNCCTEKLLFRLRLNFYRQYEVLFLFHVKQSQCFSSVFRSAAICIRNAAIATRIDVSGSSWAVSAETSSRS